MRSSPPLFAPRLDWIIFLITVGFSLTLLFFGKKPAVVGVKNEIGGVLARIEKPLSLIRHTFELWQENAALRDQVMELRRENSELRDATLENERLRAMNEFRKRTALPLKSAEVIGYPGPQIGGQILIDAGRRDGVTLNSAVLSPDGLVGKVVEVSAATSQVQTLVGNAYGVSVMIERSRVAGILRWVEPGHWTIVGLSTGEDMRVGDLVLTAGAGTVFPKGIRVGVVSKVGGQTEAKSGWCHVQPFVDFDMIEEVFVVTAPDTTAAPKAVSTVTAGRP